MNDLEIELPSGGRLQLQSEEEVELWKQTFKRYQLAYSLQKPNDLILLGSILTQQLILFRAQQRLNGMEAVLDASGIPTGKVRRIELKASETTSLQKQIRDASGEIRDLEKALGIDKKAQPLDAKLLTPEGWKLMGEVEVGDLVIGSNGEPVVVTGVYPQGEAEVWRVRFTDGSAVETTADHLWTVSCDWHERKGLAPLTLPLSEIITTLGPGKHFGGRGNPWHAPSRPKVRFASSAELPIPPYVLGALLGDGGLTRPGAVTFHNFDREVCAAVAARLPASVELNQPKRGLARIRKRFGPRSAPNPILDALRSLGLHGLGACEKFIPRDYLISSVRDRLELLAGLVDTDGHASRRTGGICYVTCSDRLADDIQFLLWSLGLRCGRSRVRPQSGRIRGRGGWYLTFRAPVGLPVAHPQRRRWIRRSKYRRDKLSIVGAERVGIKATQCISVAAGDGLYITDCFVPTHNTREAGGQHTVASYVEELKRAAHQYGIHVSKRVKLYEKFVMELRWRLRLLENGDAEDRAYHGISEDKIIAWCREQLESLEDADKKFASDKGRLWVGRL